MVRLDGAGKWTFSKVIENSPESVKEIEIEKSNTVWVKRVPNQILKLQLTDDYSLVKNRTFFEFPNVSYVNISYFQNQLLASTSSNVYRFDLAKKKFVLENSFPRQQSVVKFFNSGGKKVLALSSNGLLSTWKQNKLYQASYFDSKSFIDGSEQIKALDEDNLMFCLEEGFAVGNYIQLFNFTTFV